jgi:hypothetical protein
MRFNRERVKPIPVPGAAKGLSSPAHGNFAWLAEIETEPRPSDIQTKHM